MYNIRESHTIDKDQFVKVYESHKERIDLNSKFSDIDILLSRFVGDYKLILEIYIEETDEIVGYVTGVVFKDNKYQITNMISTNSDVLKTTSAESFHTLLKSKDIESLMLYCHPKTPVKYWVMSRMGRPDLYSLNKESIRSHLVELKLK